MKAKSIADDHDQRYSHYSEFDKEKYYLLKAHKLMQDFFHDHSPKKVLDVGCADGSFAKMIKAEFGCEVFGVDISKKAVESAKKNGIKAEKLNIEEGLPFKDETFDLIFSFEVIEHIYDTDFFLSELKRVLKQGGVLILTTPNLASLPNRLKIFFGVYPSFVPEYRIGGAGHIRAYTFSALEDHLRSKGLLVIKRTSPNITFPMTSKIMPFFLKRIAISLGGVIPGFGSHIIVAAKKSS